MSGTHDVANDVGLVDAHFHVIGPLERFPMLASRSYTPEPAPLARWVDTLGPLGVTHGVVVQPSIYGTDHRALLATLDEGAGRLAGVAAVGPDVSDADLDALVAAGVRGVRMAHFEPGDPRAMGGFVPFAAFDALAPRLRERGLHLQLFTDGRLLDSVSDRLVRSGVEVVIDHMGRTPARLGAAHAGIAAMIGLMRDGVAWVKLSGIANVSDAAPDFDDARRVHEALVDACPDRLVWGSDWPHTRPAGGRPSTAHLLGLVRRWTPPAWHDAVLGGNAARLYGFDRPRG